jgi:hypothetical protein
MTDKNARVWTGTEWANISTPLISPNAIAAYQASAPASAFTGQIWIDSDSTINVFDANDYLSKVDASANYLRISSASATYLTQSSASTTYARINSPSFTGTVNFTSASVVFNSASVSGLPSGSTVVNSNLLYNGAMQVHQRIAVATSANFGSNYNGYLTSDRWFSEVPYLLAYGTISQTIENDAPTGSGFRKSLKHTYTGADAASSSKYMWISQKLEGQDVQAIKKGTSSAQSLTLSFWVKSNLTGTYIAELVDVDNTRYVSQAYTVSASATWEFKTVTFPADTTGVLDNDNNESLRLNFWLRGGSNYSGGSSLQNTWGTTTNTRAVGQVNLSDTANNYWQITGVKLEVGSSATGYEFKSYNRELSECQRYYFKTFDQGVTPIQNVGNSNGAIVGSSAATNISFSCSMSFPVTMRATPTLTFFSPDSATSDFTAQAGVRAVVLSSSAGTNGFQVRGGTNVLAGGVYAIHAIAVVEL